MIIAVMCFSYEEAREAYATWLSFLENNEPETIESYTRFGLIVDTDYFRYIFCDYHMLDDIEKCADTILDLECFNYIEGVTTVPII